MLRGKNEKLLWTEIIVNRGEQKKGLGRSEGRRENGKKQVEKGREGRKEEGKLRERESLLQGYCISGLEDLITTLYL
jgi:hypothetical protein